VEWEQGEGVPTEGIGAGSNQGKREEGGIIPLATCSAGARGKIEQFLFLPGGRRSGQRNQGWKGPVATLTPGMKVQENTSEGLPIRKAERVGGGKSGNDNRCPWGKRKRLLADQERVGDLYMGGDGSHDNGTCEDGVDEKVQKLSDGVRGGEGGWGRKRV